jgi:hypothetical protein
MASVIHRPAGCAGQDGARRAGGARHGVDRGNRIATVYTVIILSALSLSTAVFLILELDSPFEGVIRISDAPYCTMMKECGR